MNRDFLKSVAQTSMRCHFLSWRSTALNRWRIKNRYKRNQIEIQVCRLHPTSNQPQFGLQWMQMNRLSIYSIKYRIDSIYAVSITVLIWIRSNMCNKLVTIYNAPPLSAGLFILSKMFGREWSWGNYTTWTKGDAPILGGELFRGIIKDSFCRYYGNWTHKTSFKSGVEKWSVQCRESFF